MTSALRVGLGVMLTVGVLACGEDRLPDYRRDAGARRDAGPREDAGEVDAGPPDSGMPFDAGRFIRGLEARCESIGPRCTCSEPLDTNGYEAVGMRWADPIDSTTELRPCVGQIGNGSVWFPVETLQIVPAERFPAGHRVSSTWTNTSTGAAERSHIFGTAPSREASVRMCTRVYVRFSDDYRGRDSDTGGSCAENAQARFAFDTPEGGMPSELVLEERGGAFVLEARNFGGMPTQSILTSGATLSHADCRAGWCRVEMCASGMLQTGVGIRAEAYVTALASGSAMTFTPTSVGDATAGRITDVRIADMTRMGTCPGSRSYSYAMQAEWQEDTGQLIGRAFEIEP